MNAADAVTVKTKTTQLPKKKTHELYDYQELMEFLLSNKLVDREDAEQWWHWLTDTVDQMANNSHVHIPIGHWGYRCAGCGSTKLSKAPAWKRLHSTPTCKETRESMTPPEQYRKEEHRPVSPGEAVREAAAFRVLQQFERFADKNGDLVVFMCYS